MKKLLIIVFAFPPYNSGSGWLRTYNFYKYLPNYGWNPHVLTVKESAYEFIDQTIDAETLQNVTRVNCFDAKRSFAIRGRYPAALAFPDRYWSWLPFALVSGTRIIKRETISALYSTFQVPTAHLIALALKRLTGLPWIADFRDPWVEDYLPARSILRSRLEGYLEKLVVRSADLVLLTTDSLRDYFIRRHPLLNPDKFHVIYNGYDERYLASVLNSAPPERNEYFEIVHAGAVNGEFRNPHPVMRSLKELISENQFSSDNVRLTFIGSGEYTHSARFLQSVDELGLQKVVQIKDRLPYSSCLQSLRAADLLLLLQHSQEVQMLVPAKTFEYLRIGRPILALAEDGETKRLIESCNAGTAADPSDIQRIKEAILHAYRTHGKGSMVWTAGSNKILKYSREAQTGTLAAYLDEMIEPTTSA